MSTEQEFGFYVYGITASGTKWERMVGIEGELPEYAIPLARIQAVISRVPLESFGRTAVPSGIRDPAWPRSKELAQEHVVHAIFENDTIIPTKMGVLFKSELEIRRWLDEHYDEFRFLLAYLEDRAEWEVKAFADRARLRAEIEERDTFIRKQKEENGHKPPGPAYLLQYELENQIITRVDQILVDSGRAAYDHLLALAVEGRMLRLLLGETPSSKEDMILNAVFLIQRERAPLFCCEAEKLEIQHEWRHVGCTGPRAPYNFLEAR